MRKSAGLFLPQELALSMMPANQSNFSFQQLKAPTAKITSTRQLGRRETDDGKSVSIYSQNINGSHQSKIQSVSEEAKAKKYDIILLQETKMKKEEEQAFKFHTANHFLMVLDNLSLVRAPQQEIGGSEGLLIGIRKDQTTGAPIWQTTVITHPSHRVLSCENGKNKEFFTELENHIESTNNLVRGKNILSVIAGDFNATVDKGDDRNFTRPNHNNQPSKDKQKGPRWTTHLPLQIPHRPLCYQ